MNGIYLPYKIHHTLLPAECIISLAVRDVETEIRRQSATWQHINKRAHTHTRGHTLTRTLTTTNKQHTKLLSLRAWQTFRAVYPLQVRFTATSIHIPKEKHNNFPLFPSFSLALTFSLLITLFTHFEYKIVMCWFALTDACPAYKKSRLAFFLFSFHSRAAVWDDESVEGSSQHVNDTNTNKHTHTHGEPHTLTQWESHCHKGQTFKGASKRNHKSVAYLRARL